MREAHVQLTSAEFVEPYVLLEILACKTLVQKFIFLPRFLPRPGERYEHRLRPDIDLGPKIMTVFAELAEFEQDLIGDRTSAGLEVA